jgi:APA family basic amino acid/polyamine antiporter
MRRDLERTLSFRDIALLVVGNVIGSGIFIVPATVLSAVDGDVGTAQLVWLLGGVLSLLGALTYGELGAMKPEAGGLYVFMRDAFGPFVAFLFGWTLFFAIGAGSLATLGAAFAGYLSQFVQLSTFGTRAVAVLMVIAVAAINIRGTRQAAAVNNWTTAFKFCAVVLIGVALFVAGDGVGDQGGSYLPQDLGIGNLPAIGLALIGVLWAFEGWQWVTFTAGETIDPGRSFPKGIAIGTIAIIAVYSLANIGYLAALGPERAMQTPSIASTAVETVFGGTAGRLVAAAILVSIFSAANATVLTASRVVFAMARDGLFFRRLGEVHATLRTPALSIAAFSAWAMVLAAAGRFEQLLTYVVFAGWLFYGIGAAAIFVFRRRDPHAPRPFRVPGYPLTPLLFVLAAAAIVANTLFGQPREAGIGVVVVLVGAPAYLVWRKGGAHA